MTVYELIRQLVKLPPDAPVHVLRAEQAGGRRQRIINVTDANWTGRQGHREPPAAQIFTQWEDA